MNTAPLEQRFWKLVRKTSSHWLFTGALTSGGYGHIFVKPRYIGAHRVSWELHKGLIPEGSWVLHKRICTRKDCVNPDHLYLGSPADNVHDCVEMGHHRYLVKK